MYEIITRCYPRRSSDKFRRPVRLIVADVSAGIKSTYRRNDSTVVKVWENVDSRYSGPRSEYGQALAAATRLCEELNADAKHLQSVVVDN